MQFFKGNFVGVDFFQEGFLRQVVFAHYAGFALKHAPGFAAFDGEQDHLARDGEEFYFSVDFGFDVDAEVGDVGAVFGIEYLPVDNVVLADADQHVVYVDEFLGLFFGDCFEVFSEAGFGQGPVGYGKVVFFAGGFVFSLPPVFGWGGVSLQAEGFLGSFSGARVEDEFGHAARVADHFCLIGGHVVGHAVFRLASGVGLEEGGAAVFDAVEHGTVQFGGVGH